MKTVKSSLFAFVLCASFALCVRAEYCSTKEQAQAAAEGLYAKGSSFVDAIEKGRLKYAALRDEALDALKGDVKFGQWYFSYSLGGNPWPTLSNASVAINALDPTVNKFNPEEIFDGKKIWSKRDVDYGAVNLYFDLNPRYLGSAVNFGYCEIEAAKETSICVTVSAYSRTLCFLNGERVAGESIGYAMCPPMFIKLDLKKGKNVFVVRMQPASTKQAPRFYFSPFADPAIFMAQKLAADYPYFHGIMNRFEGKNAEVREASFFADKSALNSLFNIPWKASQCATFKGVELDAELAKLEADKTPASSVKWFEYFGHIVEAIDYDAAVVYDPKNVAAAIADMEKKFPDYPKGNLEKALEWQKRMPGIMKARAAADKAAGEDLKKWQDFARGALIANPLLQKTNKWVFIKRDPKSPLQGLPQNWQGNHVLKKNIKPDQKWDDEMWTFTVKGADVEENLLFKPEGTKGVLDLEIDWDAGKIMFSSLTPKNNFQLFEIGADGKNPRMLTPEIYENADNYDGVYLPDGRIIFCSTMTYVGVPCVSGTDYVANLFVMDQNAGDAAAVDKSTRQLTFEQDADWMPTVMDNGRVMFTRWEYTDNSHYFARILMHMNPDGTAQSSYYGSTSYWPNSLFYCRQIPNEPTKFVGIVSGHHGTRRSGEMHVFDVSKGTVEAEGEVHNFMSCGRPFEAEIIDQLVDDKWPHFLHPYPLSADYVVASMRDFNYDWGIYLVDTFGNATLLAKTPYRMSLEPMPLAKRERPPAIADKTDPDLETGSVFLTDIYQGPGLKGVPRGTVKALRVFEYYYCYRDMGSHDAISQEGSWDVKRIHGTVPVEDDGSAMFTVPANRPIAIQPLDAEGKALALMRSWFVVRPGEVQSCVGCHEGQGMTPTTMPAKAGRKAPSKIKPFRAPVRGYSFERDVQPMLDKYCVGCHDGADKNTPNFSTKQPLGMRNFSMPYLNLHPYVRRTGPESNQNLLSPLEFHSSTSELVQMLEKGHKGVEMSKEDYDMLLTWIDLNVPYRGTWTEYRPISNDQHSLRMETLSKYANRHDDPEKTVQVFQPQEFVKPKEERRHAAAQIRADGFPFDAAKAKQMQAESGLPSRIEIDLGAGKKLYLKLIPAGEFVMGANDGFYDEGPARLQKIDKPFYMGQFEISNAQYAAFDPKHDSGHLDRQWKDHVNKGYPANEPDQSVIRVSFSEAAGFCKWLSEKTGVEISLPTEAQWEWAARAGTDTPFYYGGMDSDFSGYENLADLKIKEFAVFGVDPQPVPNPIPFNAFTPADVRFDDGALVHVKSGSYAPNAFGLYDMLGNVCEWTRDGYTETLGGKAVEGRMAVRGGSWRDRPKWARVTMRKAYSPWQKVYNVGLRIVIEDADKAAKAFRSVSDLPAKEAKGVPILKDTLDTSPERWKLSKPKTAEGNLVQNGGFEDPQLTAQVQPLPADTIPFWQSNQKSIEIWKGSAHNSPAYNSTGAPTLQHLEIASDGTPPYMVWQEMLIPAGVKGRSFTLSFEAWPRAMSKSSVRVFVNGKKVLDEPLKGEKGKWTLHSFEIPSVNSGDKVKILFYEEASGVSWHIDSVNFTLKN